MAYMGGTTLALFAYNKFGIKEAVAAIPGGSLDPNGIRKYVTPLLIPPQMPRAGILFERGQLIDYYEIAVRQFQQQILPAPLGKTTVWGYGPAKALSPLALRIFNAPSLTIEANAGIPVRIKWINQLVDAKGKCLPHLLPIDPTLHWANPPGGTAGRDTRPTFTVKPSPYAGPVPMVPHVHGAVGVGDDSDGYAEAWWLPNASNISTDYADYAKVGTWYDFFAAKAKSKYGVTWGPGFATFQYPNDQRACTLWYHDHTLGMTSKNVYAGPAGFFIIRGGPAGDSAVRNSRTGARAILPGPAPSEIDQVIRTRKFYEIPIVIQDRSFNDDGSLFYPDSREFFDGVTRHKPETDIAPIHNPEFFGNCIMVNGATWPKLQVEQRRYRLRLLNGCGSRALVLKFDDPAIKVWQIGNEAGFLASPVNVNATPPDSSVADNGKAVLLMGNAERADLIVDFTNVPAGTQVILRNVGPDAPFGGFPIDQSDMADPDTTGQVMRFDVVAATGADLSTPPQYLRLPAIAASPASKRTRKLCLVELTSPFVGDVPAETRLGTVDHVSGKYEAKMWMDEVTENPGVGDTEVWEFYNTTVDAHPIHVHEVGLEVVDRQAITVTPTSTEEGTGTVTLIGGTVRGPEPWERGHKDAVLCLPGEVTRVKATFSNPGQFVWHCHIVEHEDNEMMRPYRIGPRQYGQPR